MNDVSAFACGRAETRLLRALARSRAFAQLDAEVGDDGAGDGCVRVRVYCGLPGSSDVVHHARLDVWQKVSRAGLVEAKPGERPCWRISAAGRELLRSVRGAARPQRARETCADVARTAGSRTGLVRDVPVQTCESPLGWLYRRRDRSGERLISETQLQAGERLRVDFEIAQLRPRLTVDWGRAASGGGQRGAGAEGALNLSERAVAARERFGRALQAVGPELASVLVDVCCHLKGLEQLEKAAGWPQRSAKIVLLMGLSALVRHYGLGGREREEERARSGPVRVQHWGAAGYRPTGTTAGDEGAER